MSCENYQTKTCLHCICSTCKHINSFSEQELDGLRIFHWCTREGKSSSRRDDPSRGFIIGLITVYDCNAYERSSEI
jgi:hypothetical protein